MSFNPYNSSASGQSDLRPGQQVGGAIIYEELSVLSLSQRLGRLRTVCYSFTAMLIFGLLMVLLALVVAPLSSGLFIALSAIFGLLTAVYLIGLNVRRLHDLDRSGWWLLLHFTPIFNSVLVFIVPPTPAGAAFLLIFPAVSYLLSFYLLVFSGTPGMNRFGTPNPPASWLVLSVGGILWTLYSLSYLASFALLFLSWFAPEWVTQWVEQLMQFMPYEWRQEIGKAAARAG